MNIAHSFRARVGILLGALALMSLAAIPLIGTAQDTRPSGQLSEEWLLSEGEHIWNTVCIACHQPDGKGIEGIYLPINGNPLVTTEDPTYLVSTILTGRGGMPTFANIYTDEEIAAVATYLRQAWEHDAGAVDAVFVSEVRAEVIAQPEASPTPIGQRPGGIDTSTPVATPED